MVVAIVKKLRCFRGLSFGFDLEPCFFFGENNDLSK